MDEATQSGSGSQQEPQEGTLLARLLKENAELKAKVKQLEGHKAAIRRIVITGGPCGGKTSAMTDLRDRLEKAGWRVFCVPEAATLLFANGVRFQDFGVVEFQTQLANLQMRLEGTMYDLASGTGQKSVLLCDRGTMDGKAYCSPQEWSFILNALGQSEAHLRDRRYEAVIHLMTAANGAESAYSLEQAEGGSSARTETPEQARERDDSTIQAWVGHEHFFIIDNSTAFDEKLKRVANRVFEVLGEAVPGHTKRTFRVPFCPWGDIQKNAADAGVVNCRVFKCDTTYTAPESRIRLRSELNGRGASFWIETFSPEGGSRPVQKARLDGRSYMRRLREAQAEGAKTLEKEIVCFHWEGSVYEVNVFHEPAKVCILEVEAESMKASIPIPPFLSGQSEGESREVTLDPAYDPRAIAERRRSKTPCREGSL